MKLQKALLLSLFCGALIMSGCDSGGDNDGRNDIDGVWEGNLQGFDIFFEFDDDEVTVYFEDPELGNCFIVETWDIEDVDRDTYTVDVFGEEMEFKVDIDDDEMELTFTDGELEGISIDLERSNEDVDDLDECSNAAKTGRTLKSLL